MKYPRGSSEFDRTLGFLDAIFGFALTLLITNIDMPAPEQWADLGGTLASGFGTQLVGFLISFVVIAVFWRTNVGIVQRLSALDGPALTWNIVLVGLIIFLPFTTQGISDPAVSGLAVTTILYSINVSAAILAQIVMYQGAVRRGLLLEPQSERLTRAGLIDALLKPAVFIGSIPVTLAFGGEVGKMTWLLLLIISPLSGMWVNRIEREERQSSGHLH